MARKPLENEIAPVKPHLTRGTGGVAAEVLDVRTDLQRCMNRIEQEFPLIEQASVARLWIDGTNGDDSNDGTTEAKAVKHVPALRKLIPKYISSHFLIINMRGVIDLNEDEGSVDSGYDAPVDKVLEFRTLPGAEADAGAAVAPIIIVDGGSDVTTVLDNGSGGNIVSDINGVGQVGLTTAGWTPNDHKGWWVRFKTGTLAGEAFPVKTNSATTLNFISYQDPGAGAEFVLERPTTEVTSGYFFTGEDRTLGLLLQGPGKIHLQNIYFSGGASFDLVSVGDVSYNTLLASHVIIEGENTIFPFVISTGGFAIFGGDIWDVDTLTASDSFIGVTVRKDPFISCIWVYCPNPAGMYWCVMPATFVWFCSGDMQFYGSKVRNFNFMGSHTTGHGGYHTIGSTLEFGGGWEIKMEIGGDAISGPISEPAIELYNSAIDINRAICDYAEHGIKARGSKVAMGGVEGSNNAKTGCWADFHSSVLQPASGDVNTVQSSGGVELSKDGSTQVSSWVALQNLAAAGSIQAVAQANLLDNETFVVDDGNNPAITFEFQVTGGFVPTGGAVEVVDVTAAVTADDVALAIANAINGSTGTLDVTAADPTGGSLVNLTNDVPGAAGNVAITETVTDAGFVVTGMTGGQDETPVVTPEVIAREAAPANYSW